MNGKTEINSIKLKDNTIISVGDIVIDKDTLFTHYPFKVKGIFLATNGQYCFYMANPKTDKYYGNSDEANNYKIHKP